MSIRVENHPSQVQDQFLKHSDPNAKWDPVTDIPVIEKMPSSSGFSYPISASALSAPLRDLPMYSSMVLRYSNQTPILKMESPLREFPLIRITGTHYPTYKSDPRQGGLRYMIEVLLTPYNHREFIKGVIVEKALPLLRELLRGPEHPVALGGRVVAEFWYEVGTNVVTPRAMA